MPGQSSRSDPEYPRDLRGAPAVVTGVVEHVDGWTCLVSPAGRWALTGDAVAGLRPGDRVTVRGWLSGVPDGCPARYLLRVFLVT
jgi:hypothetical protein